MKHYLELLLVVAVVAVLAAWTRPTPIDTSNQDGKVYCRVSHSFGSPKVRIASPVGSIFPAVDQGDVNEVRALLADNAAFYARQHNQYGSTPLHHAVASGRLDIMELLIKAGADVNASDHYGLAPLHWAAKKGNLAVVEFLLGHGARANQGKVRPADMARQYRERDWQKVAALLDAAETRPRAQAATGLSPDSVEFQHR